MNGVKTTTLAFAFFLGVGISYFVLNGPSLPFFDNLSAAKDDYVGLPIGNSSTVACTFERTTGVSYEEGKIVHSTPHKESDPLVSIFSDLNTQRPKHKAVGAGNSVYESDMIILSNTPEKITLGEITPIEGNVFVYTIHKDSGVGTWTKQYQILGIPSGSIGMGKCSSS